MGAFLSQASAIIPNVRHLSITPRHQEITWDVYWKHTGLLMLLCSFDAVETLHVGGQLTDRFPPILNNLSDELVAKVLPALRLLNIEGKPLVLVKQLLVPFIERRQFIGLPPLTIVAT